MKYSIPKLMLFIPVALVLILTGCDSTGSDGNQPSLSLSFMAKNSSVSSKTQTTELASDHITITEAKMLIRRIKFKSDLEDDGIPDDSLDFQTEPQVVSLNLDGTPNQITVQEVQPGRYDEIEFDVHKPEDGETPPDPEFKIGESGDERFSIIIRGTHNGEDFTYRSSENLDQELELNTPLTIDENTQNTNVTLTINLAEWFVEENGNNLDPTVANNENAIDESLERSFEDVFEDNDEDGEDDD